MKFTNMVRLSGIALVGMFVPTGAVHAAQTSYAGAACQPCSNSVTSWDLAYGAFNNYANFGQCVFCPVVQHQRNSCYTDFDISWNDNSDDGEISCSPFSANSVTGSYITGGWQYSGISSITSDTWDWPGLSSCYTGEDSKYYVKCNLPPVEGPGIASYIGGYSMDE
jgi:hypothetical protein